MVLISHTHDVFLAVCFLFLVVRRVLVSQDEGTIVPCPGNPEEPAPALQNPSVVEEKRVGAATEHDLAMARGLGHVASGLKERCEGLIHRSHATLHRKELVEGIHEQHRRLVAVGKLQGPRKRLERVARRDVLDAHASPHVVVHARLHGRVADGTGREGHDRRLGLVRAAFAAEHEHDALATLGARKAILQQERGLSGVLGTVQIEQRLV